MPSYEEIIANFQAQQEAARLRNEERYAEALQIYDEVISTYQPEGGFLAGAEAELGKQKGRAVAGQEQSLVSSGLFGTSITAGLGQKWEAEVGQPARLKLEDVRMGRLTEALQAKAGVIERRDDIGPDYATIAALSQQAGARPTTVYGRPSGYQQPSVGGETEYGTEWMPDPIGEPSWVRGGGGAAPSAPATPRRFPPTLAETEAGTQAAGPSGRQMSDAEMQEMLARNATPQEYAAGGQLSQDIFGAMSGFAGQAAGAMGAGGTSAQPAVGSPEWKVAQAERTRQSSARFESAYQAAGGTGTRFAFQQREGFRAY